LEYTSQGRRSLLVANVVAMRSTWVGDYVYRVSQPSRALGRIAGVEVVTVGVTSPHLAAVCAAADVLVLHLLTEEDLIPLLQERRRRGQPTVYEISDNFLATHPGIGIDRYFADAGNRANALHLIGMADAVQVTGPGLRAAFGGLHPRTVVLENQIDALGAAPRAAGPTVTVGWAGSVGHRGDLQHVSRTLEELCLGHENVIISFMGERSMFDETLAALPDGRKRYTPPGTLADYLAFLETLDIGIAPMLGTAYNQCRSDVKYLEYASRGVVPVLSRIAPYLAHAVDGETAFLFQDTAELGAILSRLVSAPDERQRVARRARAYVAQERMEARGAQARLALYQDLRPSREPRPALDVPTVKEQADSESYDVARTAEEDLVIQAIHCAAASDFDQARALLQRAAAGRAGYALPTFWSGRTYELGREPAKAATLYRRALELDPQSVRARLHLARACAAAGDLKAALEAARGALALTGDHARTLTVAAEVYEAAGDLAGAGALYRRALDACRGYGPAALGLGQLATTASDGDRVRHALEDALALGPQDPSIHQALAGRLLGAGDVASAAHHCALALELDAGHVGARGLLPKIIAALEDDARPRASVV
jgi:tetratricopeptide (TPR) repeat protein